MLLDIEMVKQISQQLVEIQKTTRIFGEILAFEQKLIKVTENVFLVPTRLFFNSSYHLQIKNTKIIDFRDIDTEMYEEPLCHRILDELIKIEKPFVKDRITTAIQTFDEEVLNGNFNCNEYSIFDNFAIKLEMEEIDQFTFCFIVITDTVYKGNIIKIPFEDGWKEILVDAFIKFIGRITQEGKHKIYI